MQHEDSNCSMKIEAVTTAINESFFLCLMKVIWSVVIESRIDTLSVDIFNVIFNLYNA
jgi:hypothetical protein